jgi:hypothetical protein
MRGGYFSNSRKDLRKFVIANSVTVKCLLVINKMMGGHCFGLSFYSRPQKTKSE